MTDYSDDRVADFERKMRAAKTDDCRRSWAAKVVEAKHERGDFMIQGPLPENVFQALVAQELRG